MEPEVEARSLTDLNFLAANPPQYPANPTEAPRESLVLYISRVPGTRDIILSTFKPQIKNVTVIDVANSLYYVHLDSVADEIIAASAARQLKGAESPRSSIESARAPIQRKPVPSAAAASSAPPMPTVPPTAVSEPTPLLATQRSAPATQPVPRPLEVPKPLEVPQSLAVPQSPRSGPTTPKPISHERPEVQDPTTVGSSAASQAGESSREGYTPNPMFRTKKPSRPPSEERPELPPRPLPKQPPPVGVPIMRKPLGPRPQGTIRPEAGPPLDDGSLSSASLGKRTVDYTRNQHSFREGGDSKPWPVAANKSQPTSPVTPTATQRATFSPFVLSLIRRDPTSGHQWNVGKVSSYQTNIPTPDQADPSLDPLDLGMPRGMSAIDIHIESSGYAKFRGMPTRQSLDVARRDRAHSSGAQGGSFPRPSMDDRTPSQAATRTVAVEEGFSRQVMMAYSKSWASNIKRAFRRRGSSSNTSPEHSPEELAPPRPFHVRHGSANSIGSGGSASSREDDEHEPAPLITQPGPGLKPRGYVFMSPWEGQCEFRTGNAGRSVKLRHRLQPMNGAFNPLVLGQSIRDGQAFNRARGASVSAAVTGAKPVSELRYNLPSSDLFAKKGDGHHSHFQDQFSKLLNLVEGYSDDEEDGPMDLSLGRERAGGGNRGKRAKLGKLIVHDEGLKMLDLVVAANVGVWWTTWERTF